MGACSGLNLIRKENVVMTTNTHPPPSGDSYLADSFETYYDSYFQEMASEALINKWQLIDRTTAFLVAATASGSAIAGWALWNAPGWKLGWAAVAGIATFASIGHGVMGVPERVKTQSDVRRSFSKLRIDVQTFRHRLKEGLEISESRQQYDALQERFGKLISETPPDLIFREKFRLRIQDQLDALLRKKGLIA
jgi:hypothetical protein